MTIKESSLEREERGGTVPWQVVKKSLSVKLMARVVHL